MSRQRLFYNLQVTFLILLGLYHRTRGHSWIACSDYTEKNGANWDSGNCRGYPRDASNYAQKDSFGQDRGFDHRPSGSGPACKTTYNSAKYTSEYPKAVYYPGQQVVIVHPMKNHGADAGCTNIYIPDNGNAIYRGNGGTDTDKSLSYYKKKLVADLGASTFGNGNTDSSTYPKQGYQNAPNFCADTDKSMGTYSFNIPQDLAAGDYTFVWRWSFNGEGDLYSTCFDVIIAADKAARDSILTGRQMSLYVACGGETSNGSPGSSVGCDGGGGGGGGGGGSITTTTTLPNTQSTTKQTTTTTTASGTSRRVAVNAFQMTGEIDLGAPMTNNVNKRFVSVHFDCPVEASFWNARLIAAHNHETRKKRHASIHYDLLQEQSDHLASRKIYYAVTFADPCNIIVNPPVATITMEE